LIEDHFKDKKVDLKYIKDPKDQTLASDSFRSIENKTVSELDGLGNTRKRDYTFGKEYSNMLSHVDSSNPNNANSNDKIQSTMSPLSNIDNIENIEFIKFKKHSEPTHINKNQINSILENKEINAKFDKFDQNSTTEPVLIELKPIDKHDLEIDGSESNMSVLDHERNNHNNDYEGRMSLK